MFGNILLNITAKISKATEKEVPETVSQESVFKLPIEYLDESDRFILQETVCDDLELSLHSSSVNSSSVNSSSVNSSSVNSSSVNSIDDPSNNAIETSKTMYHYILNPQNDFALQMIPKWRAAITTNIGFLEETQQIIQAMSSYKKTSYKPTYDTIMEIWHDTKEDPNFLERYSYMEFSMFKSLNKMPAFLQAISVVNMGSPILSFLIPFILFLFTFIILNVIPCDFFGFYLNELHYSCFIVVLPTLLSLQVRRMIVFAPDDPAGLLQILPPRHEQPGVPRVKGFRYPSPGI